MKRFAFLLAFAIWFGACQAQTRQAQTTAVTQAANKFLQSLSAAQKSKAQFSLEDEERFRWNYVPLDRKGIPLLDFNAGQRQAAMDLLNTVLSDAAFKKTNA